MGEAWQRWMEERMREVERTVGVVPAPQPVEAVADTEPTAAELEAERWPVFDFSEGGRPPPIEEPLQPASMVEVADPAGGEFELSAGAESVAGAGE